MINIPSPYPRAIMLKFCPFVFIIILLWSYEYMKNHICELQSEELFEGRSLQLYMYTQLMQLRKESLNKIQACTGFEPWTSAIPVYEKSYMWTVEWRILQIIPHSAVHIIWFFIYQYRRGQGFESRTSLNFFCFRFSFRNCISCI